MVFSKFAHSFVAIELLNFSIMKIFIFIAQERSQYSGLKKSVHKKDWFFAFCVYKNNLQRKHCFLYINVNYNDYHQQNTMCTFLYLQKTKNCQTFYIQKSRHFAKSKIISVTFLYTKIKTLHVTRFFMKKLKLAFIYIKVLHSVFRDVLIYKKPDTSC